MSSIPGNPHVDDIARATVLLNEALKPVEDDEEVLAMHGMAFQRSAVSATLALAYEQRTANLIALFGMENVADLNYGNLRKQIFERLGLEPLPQPDPHRIEDTCCGKCEGECYVDQATGA